MLDAIMAFFGRRSLENPNVSLSDPEAWNELGLGGGLSDTGVSVNRETALTLDTVWRAVNLIAGTIGRLPISVYQRDGKGWDVEPKHPAHKLLRRGPMEGMTARTFKRLLTANALLHGAGYAYIQRDGAKPAELWPLDSSQTWPVKVNGKLWYVTQIDGNQLRLSSMDVLCVLGATRDGWSPYSVFDKARESIGLGLASQKYSAKFFGNGASPSVVIEVPGTMPKDARVSFLSEWNQMHKGLENSHRTAILTNGGKVNGFSINAKDSQLLETRQFTAREIANWFGLPAHKLGDNSNASYSSLEQENQSFVDESLEDWLVAWEEECESKLLSEVEKQADDFKVEFLRRRLVRAQLSDRMAAWSVGVNARILSPNEARAEEGWNPYEGGDEFLVPLNVGNPGGDPEAVPQDTQPEADSTKTDDAKPEEPTAPVRHDVLAAHRRLVVDAARRSIKRLGTHARRAAEHPSKFSTWLDEFRTEHEPVVREIMTPAVEATATILLKSDTPDTIDELFRSIHAGLLDVSGRCKQSELARGVDELMTAHELHGAEAVADLFIKQTTQLAGV